MSKQPIVYTASGSAIVTKTPNQDLVVESIDKNDITFISGVAGSGKSYISIARGLHYLKAGVYDKLIICRPVVESGEKLGHLPGDVMEKVSPYMKPLVSFIKEIYSGDQKQKRKKRDQKQENQNSHLSLGDNIEICPLAYLRGSTFKRSYVVLDEAQNTTVTQMKMFLTRIGDGSKLVITGDDRQIDLPRNVESGLIDAIDRLTQIKGIGHIKMTEKDIVRHGIIRDIILAYEQE